MTCVNCKNPETTCNIEGKKKNMVLYLTCKGCGGRTDLDSAVCVCAYVRDCVCVFVCVCV